VLGLIDPALVAGDLGCGTGQLTEEMHADVPCPDPDRLVAGSVGLRTIGLPTARRAGPRSSATCARQLGANVVRIKLQFDASLMASPVARPSAASAGFSNHSRDDCSRENTKDTTTITTVTTRSFLEI
jgi:hypothetical protein